MVCYDEKEWKDDSSTQASVSDVANMSDFDGLDKREKRNKFSYAKSAILGVMLPFVAATNAGAMKNEDEYIGAQTALGRVYQSLYSYLQEPYSSIDPSTMREWEKLSLSEKQKDYYRGFKKILVDSEGDDIDPILFLKTEISHSSGYEKTEISSFKKYLDKIQMLESAHLKSSDCFFLASYILDDLIKKAYR